MLSLQRAEVQSLVWELRSHMPCSQKKKKKEEEEAFFFKQTNKKDYRLGNSLVV